MRVHDMLDDSRIFKRFFLIASLVIGLCVSAIFLGLAMRTKDLLNDQVIVQARAHFQGIVLTRKWSAQHGGVYVIKRPGILSNPYLENPDLKAADGRVARKIAKTVKVAADKQNLVPHAGKGHGSFAASMAPASDNTVK